MDAETLDRYGAKYLDAIAGRMVAESATDASDAEIERTLRPCVCGDMLVEVAKHLRDQGLLRPEIAKTKRMELEHEVFNIVHRGGLE